MSGLANTLAAEKNAPDTMARRAAKKDSKNHPIPPKRVPRTAPPARAPIRLKWPDDASARRVLRDDWMENVHPCFTNDIIVLRLLWPLFNGTYVTTSCVCTLTNNQLAELIGYSASVVKLGLRRLRRSGWIWQQEFDTTDKAGNPITVRRIGFAFPDGFVRAEKGGAGAASDAEPGDAGTAFDRAAAEPQGGAGADTAGAAAEPLSPVGTTLNDTPDIFPKRKAASAAELFHDLMLALESSHYLGKEALEESRLRKKAGWHCSVEYRRVGEGWAAKQPRDWLMPFVPSWDSLPPKPKAHAIDFVMSKNRHLVKETTAARQDFYKTCLGTSPAAPDTPTPAERPSRSSGES
jgi:hypothetical protein